MHIIESLESNVRSYVRSFPTVFETAEGAILWNENGDRYIDFFAGAGSLNYGHNNPRVTGALIEYLQQKGVVLSLDQATVAKQAFLQTFSDVILSPRHLEYKVQFTGPTGTNAVEASLKLARMVKGRSNILAFTNAYHGLTLGSLAITADSSYHNKFYSTRNNVSRLPFDGYFGKDIDTIPYIEKVLTDPGSGIDFPAAIIVETIQGEGGINVASEAWLKALSDLCHELDILLIVDDIQVGNGRTGLFFSFEKAGIVPDMVCLSKSIGGGLPMAILLLHPKLDQWQPGEHSGTFRGNNLAFIAATELLNYWITDDFSHAIKYRAEIMENALQKLAKIPSEKMLRIRGRGMVWGVEIPQKGLACNIVHKAFQKGLLLETCGSTGQVIKLLPPLIIDEKLLMEGLEIFIDTVNEA